MVYIENWDSGQSNAFWDRGLDWDTNVGPSPGDVQPYLNLITSEHVDKPDFMAMVAAVIQPLADSQVLMAGMPGLYDLDTAVGSQLDTTGQWIGATRNVAVALPDVYFSFDETGLGFDEATWFGPGDSEDGLVILPDDAYRTLLYAKVAANEWDGTIPGAYEIWDTLFAGTGLTILIQDLGDMSILYGLVGTPDAVTIALLEGGYLDLVPAGVRVAYYVTPSVPDVPMFGFDVENATVSGFDVGAWATLAPGN